MYIYFFLFKKKKKRRRIRKPENQKEVAERINSWKTIILGHKMSKYMS